MWRFLLIVILTLMLSSCEQPGEEPATLELEGKIFLNGTIYTGNPDRPVAEAVVVFGNRIVLVGPEVNARAYAGEAEIIDLNGAFMYPGFTDAHAHLLGIGQRELTLNLEGTTSVSDLVARLKERVEAAAPGEVIVGRGWIETHWPEGRFPTAADLDPVSPNNPVFLGRTDGHAAVVNSTLLQAAGITSETEAPFGGDILKDADGNPTGMLIDAAMNLVAEVTLSPPSREEKMRQYKVGGQVYNAYGWTGVHAMSVDPANVKIMEELASTGGLTLRVYNSLDGANPETRAIFEDGPSSSGNGLITTRAIKLYIDGALGSRGAMLLEPYADADTSGLLQTEKEAFMATLALALENGIQINTHAIGDKGNQLLLDWYEEAFSHPGVKPEIVYPRWRVEHAQILDPADIPRFAELRVIPSMQPSHAISDLYFASARLGLKRLDGAYAWRSLLDSGAIIAGGSDAPVERGDPRIEFYAAVARKDLNGFSGEGWHPELAVSRTDALKMFTIWPAYASFRENELGTIEVGKLADFTVFSTDIMEIPEAEILDADVVMTVVDGNIIYSGIYSGVNSGDDF